MSKKPKELSKRKGHKANIVKLMNESEISFLLLLLVGLRFGDREWFLQLLLAGNPVTCLTAASPRRRYRFKSTSATGRGAEGRQQDLPTFGHIHNICMYWYWYWYHLFGPGQKHVSFLGPRTWVMLGSLAQNLFSVRFASLLYCILNNLGE